MKLRSPKWVKTFPYSVDVLIIAKGFSRSGKDLCSGYDSILTLSPSIRQPSCPSGVYIAGKTTQLK